MTEPDARLVERAREGDAAAFEQLVRRHFRTVYAAALGVLGTAADAEDAAQDTFVSALERLEECRRPERVGAWLAQIGRNRALDLRRRQTVRLALPLERATGAASSSNPALDAERSDLRERLLAALAELPDVQRTVVLLHDLEGWRHREIAAELGLPDGTVRSHLHHARRRLRSLLEPGVAKEETHGSGQA